MAKKVVVKKTVKKKAIPFEELSKPEQRVAIAKDVIKHLNTGKIKATVGTYFENSFIDKHLYKLSDENKNVELQTLLEKDDVKCKVCALGGMFVVDVLNNDHLLVGKKERDIDSYLERKRLKKYFSTSQLSLIENSFEKMNIVDPTSNNWSVNYDGVEFGKKFKSPKDRLIAIMQNVIDNKGTFIPPKTNQE